jgi:hypothetical protein
MERRLGCLCTCTIKLLLLLLLLQVCQEQLAAAGAWSHAGHVMRHVVQLSLASIWQVDPLRRLHTAMS